MPYYLRVGKGSFNDDFNSTEIGLDMMMSNPKKLKTNEILKDQCLFDDLSFPTAVTLLLFFSMDSTGVSSSSILGPSAE